MEKKAVFIIPCSGIDSVYGLMTQEVALKINAEVIKQTKILGLSYLVNGEIEAVQAITNTPCIAINGCKKECASNVIDIIGGDIEKEYAIDKLVTGLDMASLGDAVKLSESGEQQVCQIANKLIADLQVAEKGVEK